MLAFSFLTKWISVFLLCCVVTSPPISVFLHNTVLLPWVFPYSALRTQELVSGAQVALILSESCKLRLFDHLEVRRAVLLGGHHSHTRLSNYETLLTFLYTGSWTRECRTVQDITLSISPSLKGDRKLRAVFRLLNSVAATGLIASTVINRERTHWSTNPGESGCFFNTNAAALFLTSIDGEADSLLRPVENTATMCGMSIISNHISVLSRVSNLANVLLSNESIPSVATSFVKPLNGDTEGSNLWEDFAKHSTSFQSQIAGRVSSQVTSRVVSQQDQQRRHHTTIVDIGGGSGVFLTDMMMSMKSSSAPHQPVSGVLFDLPGVIDGLNGCKSAFSCVGGSIFDNKSLEALHVTVRGQVSGESQDVLIMLNSFLQHFDDELSADIVDSVLMNLLQHHKDSSVRRIYISIVELVSPGGSTRTSPYISPSPIHLFDLLTANISSPECSLAEIGKCFSRLWEYFALDSLTTMGRMFSTVINSLTSSQHLEGGEVRSNAFYFHLLARVATRLGGMISCEIPNQNILFPLPASLTQMECYVL